MCRVISSGQYHFWYCPALAAINISEFQRNFHVIKWIKSVVSITALLLTLGIGRAWALSFPSLGSITMLIWTLRVLCLLYYTISPPSPWINCIWIRALFICFFLKKIDCLPIISQWIPVTFSGHVQLYISTPSKQVPLLRQGADSHSSRSRTILHNSRMFSNI